MAFTTRSLRLIKALEKYHKNKPVYFDSINISDKIKVTEANDEGIKARLTVDSSMCNAYEILHGGYIATLMDVLSLYGVLSRTGGKMSMTTNINVVFINPAKIGENLLAEAKTIKSGRKPVVEAVVYTEKGGLVAKAMTGFIAGNEEFQKITSDIIGFDILKKD